MLGGLWHNSDYADPHKTPNAVSLSVQNASE
jgi:hypothetical protein